MIYNQSMKDLTTENVIRTYKLVQMNAQGTPTRLSQSMHQSEISMLDSPEAYIRQLCICKDWLNIS